MGLIINPYRYAAGGGGGGGTPSVLANNWRHSAITLSGGGLTATRDGSSAAHRLVACLDAKLSGKWYFEATIGSVGANKTLGVGVGTALQGLTEYIGNGARKSAFFAASGEVLQNGTNAITGLGARSNGDVLGFKVDIDNLTFAMRINGGSFTSDVALSGTNPFFPMVQLYDPSDAVTLNFGATAFAHSLPSGFTGWLKNADYEGRYWDYYGITGPQPMDAIVEITHRIVSGGSNVISGGTPTASNDAGAGFEANKAIDGNTSTYWNNAFGSTRPYWWRYDYGSGVNKAIVESTVQKRSDSTFDKQTEIHFVYAKNGASSVLYPASAIAGLSWTAGETKTFAMAS